MAYAAIFWSHVAQVQVARLRDAWNRLDRDLSEADDPPTIGDWWQSNAERHYLLLAIAHLAKACDRLTTLPRLPDSDLLILLRHYAEHWEDPEGRSAKALATLRPQHASERITFTDDWFQLHGVDSRDLNRWLVDVERVARALAEGDGPPLPDASTPLD